MKYISFTIIYIILTVISWATASSIYAIFTPQLLTQKVAEKEAFATVTEPETLPEMIDVLLSD